ncbi:uncharacterized protein LOC143027559 [Oratosquilla oratoria]|uniref:uncharacterized protein LOC143027559 n=1 Tax=Oratosquilla oratoria TaxID=337810 RepID=UPI003F774FEB
MFECKFLCCICRVPDEHQRRSNRNKGSYCSRTVLSKGGNGLHKVGGTKDKPAQEMTENIFNPKKKNQKVNVPQAIPNPLEWIVANLDWVRKSIRKYEAGHHHPTVEVDDVRVTVQPSKPKKNFNAEILNVKALIDVSAHGSTLNSTLAWEYTFIIKLLPSHEFFRKEKITLECIAREKIMIAEVLPKLNEVLAQECFEKIPIPHLYFNCCEETTRRHSSNYALGIDVNGYVNGKVTEMLDLQQAKTAIQNLALLHGSSYTANKRYSIKAQYPILTSRTFDLHWCLAPKCFKHLTELLTSIGGHEETVQLIEKGGTEALSALKSRFYNQEQDHFICLCHGDYRFAHFIFTGGNVDGKDTKEEMMILDWQRVLMMNPVYDVLFFIYTSTYKNLRDSHLHELLKLYYDTFLQSCFTEHPRYTFENFCSEFESRMFFGFVMGICMAHFAMAQAEGKQKAILDLVTEAEENGNMKQYFYVKTIKPPQSGRNVTMDWLQHVFKIYGQMLSPSVECHVEKFQVHEGSSRRHGYDCEFVDMTVTTRNYQYHDSLGITDEVADHHITCKTMPCSRKYNMYKKKTKSAEKESSVIFFIIPALNKFLQARKKEKYCFPGLYLYFSEWNYPNYLLLVQNYKHTGYLSRDMLHNLNLDEAEAALEFLAKLHAVSYVYNREYNLTVDYPVVGKDNFDIFVQDIVSPRLNNIVVILSKFLTTKQIVIENKDVLLKKFTYQWKAMDTASFTCLCQGDFRINNLLFQESERSQREGFGNDIKVLDWQSVTLKHPVYDLLIFFYTSTTSEFRKQHLLRLLKSYHTNLLNIMQDLKEPINFRCLLREYPFKELCANFMEGRLFGFVMGLCVTHISEEYGFVQRVTTSENSSDRVSDRLKQKVLRYKDLFEEAERDGLLGGLFKTVGLEAVYCDPNHLH